MAEVCVRVCVCMSVCMGRDCECNEGPNTIPPRIPYVRSSGQRFLTNRYRCFLQGQLQAVFFVFRCLLGLNFNVSGFLQGGLVNRAQQTAENDDIGTGIQWGKSTLRVD